MGLVPPPPVPPLPVVPCVVPVSVVAAELVPPADVVVVGFPPLVPVVVGPAAFPVLPLVGPALVLAVPVVPAAVPLAVGPAEVFELVPLPLVTVLPLELLFESSLLHAATTRATVTEESTDARVRLSLDIGWSVYRTRNREQGAGGIRFPLAFAFFLPKAASGST